MKIEHVGVFPTYNARASKVEGMIKIYAWSRLAGMRASARRQSRNDPKRHDHGSRNAPLARRISTSSIVCRDGRRGGGAQQRVAGGLARAKVAPRRTGASKRRIYLSVGEPGGRWRYDREWRRGTNMYSRRSAARWFVPECLCIRTTTATKRIGAAGREHVSPCRQSPLLRLVPYSSHASIRMVRRQKLCLAARAWRGKVSQARRSPVQGRIPDSFRLRQCYGSAGPSGAPSRGRSRRRHPETVRRGATPYVACRSCSRPAT